MDLALVAQAATLEARVPFVHFFDGFRTSSEVQKVEELTYDDMRALIDMSWCGPPGPALTPGPAGHPRHLPEPGCVLRRPRDVNRYYVATPAIVQKAFDRFATLTGRQYHLFDYVGAPEAERVVVMMGSGAEAMEEVVTHLAPGREGRPGQGAPLPPLQRRALAGGAAAHGEGRRRAGPHQGARLPGRAPVRGRAHRHRRGHGRRAGAETLPGDRGRPLRPGLAGVQSGHGQGGPGQPESQDAQEPLHHRHHRRPDAHQPGLGQRLRLASPGHAPGPVLRPGRRRHGGGEQELDQDHRQGHGQLRAGLLRVRLEEVGGADGEPPALRPEADQELLPGAEGQLRGLPQVQLPGAHRHAVRRRGGGDLPARAPLRQGGGLGEAAGGGAEADHREETQVLRDRRPQDRGSGRAGLADQHDHADRLLPHFRRAARRRRRWSSSRRPWRTPTAARARTWWR